MELSGAAAGVANEREAAGTEGVGDAGDEFGRVAQIPAWIGRRGGKLHVELVLADGDHDMPTESGRLAAWRDR
jgi:hypothetical protein